LKLKYQITAAKCTLIDSLLHTYYSLTRKNIALSGPLKNNLVREDHGIDLIRI